MSKFVSKPVQPHYIDAEQWFPGTDHPDIYLEPITKYGIYFCGTGSGQRINAGDWIITKADGSVMRIMSDLQFTSLYEPA